MNKIEDIFKIDARKVQRLFLVPKFDPSRWMVLSVRDVALCFFYLGILITFYGQLSPWFLWRIYSYDQFFAFLPLVVSLLLSRTLSRPLFTRKDYLWPSFAYFVYALLLCILTGRNMNGYIAEFFKGIVFMFIFMLDKDEVPKLGTMLCKSMAILLVPSIVFFFLYLFGFPLPHSYAEPPFSDFYSYENYLFFLLDERFSLFIFPRFHSVFLEPSHMASACVALLMTQVGHWKKWYNIVIFSALVISFSLAGYVFLVMMFFCSSWMKGKAIMRKLMVLVGFIATVVIVSLFYNEGENLVNELIVQRMVLNEEGNLEGDNRVTQDFDAAFDDFVQSDHLLTGMGNDSMEQFGFGNSGFRVYLYRNGLISFLFLVLFFLSMAFTSTYKRGIVVMALFHIASFIAHGNPLRAFFFIPFYILMFTPLLPSSLKDKEYTETENNSREQ